ncbi:phage tail protein [Aliikangiella marina]|uniref:Phage tail protein n=2 Tax=Aliikangiella marina TaxID=1712262 RepID=A0A545T3C4_9GAMM|nr:phage tail protein [Aliikangiella marina]
MVWDAERKALVLAQNQDIKISRISAIDAVLAWENSTPLAIDEFYQQARLSSDGSYIEYNSGRGFQPLMDGNLRLVDAPYGNFTDIAVGGDGRLVAGYSNDSDQHGLLVFQLAKRWQAAVALVEKPIRVAIDQENRVWAVSEANLFCCEGEPIPHAYQPQATRFEPVEINPNPLRLIYQKPLDGTDIPLALNIDDQQLGILVRHGDDTQSILLENFNQPSEDFERYLIQSEYGLMTDFAFLTHSKIAGLVPRDPTDTEYRQRDCLIVALISEANGENSGVVLRERYPMLSQFSARFVRSADGINRYQAEVSIDSEQALAGYQVYPRQVLALPRPKYITAAMASLSEQLDSSQPDTVWHRVYLEGCIPSGCKVTLYVKAYNSPEEKTTSRYIEQPDWIWCNHRSEQAFGQGLVSAKPNSSGLFEVLLQRDSGPVRRITGRYLQIRLKLESNGKSTPEIHALKVYYPRHSYQEAYLPQHFHQENSVDKSLDHLNANGADVRERLLAAFEGVLTPIENQIVAAETIINPQNTPLNNLYWLAELFGQRIQSHWPEDRQRSWIENAGSIQKFRGTLCGLNQALDIATSGGVSKGQIVVVENYLLRRTMSTILGLDMDDKQHPLTLGTGESGNSIVGDSLFLSDEHSREFMALFAEELGDDSDQKTVDKFFDKYAHRLSILVHGDAQAQVQVVKEVLTTQVPAHLEWKIIETDTPFVLGLAPLLGIDTYLENEVKGRPVILNDIYLGKEGLLTNPAAFSPQDINARVN